MGKRRGKSAEVCPFVAVGSPKPLRAPGASQLLRRFRTLVKKFVHRDAERPGEFLQRLDVRYGVAIFNYGDVAAHEPRALLNIALAEIPSFAKIPKPLTYLHDQKRTPA